MSLESKGIGEELNVERRMSVKEGGVDETESADLGDCKLMIFQAH